jgi:membrane protein implicated in regulation of membrane protease activity
MEQLKKDIRFWYSKLERRGRIFLGLAIAGLIWLLVQFGFALAGRPLLSGWPALILNLVSLTFITLIVAQFYMVRTMTRNAREQYRELAVRGRREGNRAEQVTGMRNRGSMRRRGGTQTATQAISMITQVNVEDLDKQYRPKPVARPKLVADWKEIAEPGLYALESSPKQKIEIIDAADVGGGYFVGIYAGSLLKNRTIMTHKHSGEPLRFSTLRNAKKALDTGVRQIGK